MNFGEAIEALKAGKKIARGGWIYKFLWLKPETEIPTAWCKDPVLKKLAEDCGGKITGLPTICLYNGDKSIVTGWFATAEDMLATDWKVV